MSQKVISSTHKYGENPVMMTVMKHRPLVYSFLTASKLGNLSTQGNIISDQKFLNRGQQKNLSSDSKKKKKIRPLGFGVQKKRHQNIQSLDVSLTFRKIHWLWHLERSWPNWFSGWKVKRITYSQQNQLSKTQASQENQDVVVQSIQPTRDRLSSWRIFRLKPAQRERERQRKTREGADLESKMKLRRVEGIDFLWHFPLKKSSELLKKDRQIERERDREHI